MSRKVVEVLAQFDANDIEFFIRNDISLLRVLLDSLPTTLIYFFKLTLDKEAVRNFKVDDAINYFRGERPDLYALFESDEGRRWLERQVEEIREFLLG